jgi:peroxiredoxin
MMKIILFSISLLLFLVGHAQIKQGMPAPEIALKNVEGKIVPLSSLKGKVILLDFWASWCGPCRKENKHLVKLYAKYKSKGFEIYSVSLDDDINDWKTAIAADKLTWTQVNDNGGWQAPTANQWNIQQIPTTYLIDKKGMLLAMDVERHALEKMVTGLLNR